MNYKHQSGAENRKKKKLQEEVFKKSIKITSFFTTKNDGEQMPDQ